jgi:hypothetical protein
MGINALLVENATLRLLGGIQGILSPHHQVQFYVTTSEICDHNVTTVILTKVETVQSFTEKW